MLGQFILASPVTGEGRNRCSIISRDEYYKTLPLYEPVASFETEEEATEALKTAERLGGAKEYLSAMAKLWGGFRKE